MNALLKGIPPDIMLANKRLVEIEDAFEKGGLTLHFQDGTKGYADTLIGADGYHGYTRKHILGSHPSVDAKFGGFWDCGFLVPIDKARSVLGREYFKENRQYGWCGEGRLFMHDVLDDGKTVQCVAAVAEGTRGEDEWKRDLDRESLEESFEGCKNSPIASKMIEVCCSISLSMFN